MSTSALFGDVTLKPAAAGSAGAGLEADLTAILGLGTFRTAGTGAPSRWPRRSAIGLAAALMLTMLLPVPAFLKQRPSPSAVALPARPVRAGARLPISTTPTHPGAIVARPGDGGALNRTGSAVPAAATLPGSPTSVDGGSSLATTSLPRPATPSSPRAAMAVPRWHVEKHLARTNAVERRPGMATVVRSNGANTGTQSLARNSPSADDHVSAENVLPSARATIAATPPLLAPAQHVTSMVERGKADPSLGMKAAQAGGNAPTNIRKRGHKDGNLEAIDALRQLRRQ